MRNLAVNANLTSGNSLPFDVNFRLWNVTDKDSNNLRDNTGIGQAVDLFSNFNVVQNL